MEITITMKIDNEELKDLIGLQEDKPKVKVEVTRKSEAKPVFRVFDERCLAWTRDPEANKIFLLQQQRHANEKLKQQGHLFLNEVYDMLGMPRTRTGQIEGWIYDQNYPWRSYVDFGLFTYHFQPMDKGLEKYECLVFNVDGNILDQLWEEP